jgi:flotillin
VLAQMPEVVESLTGVDIKKYFQEKFKAENKDED